MKVSRLYEQSVQRHQRENVMHFNKLDMERVGLYSVVIQERNKEGKKKGKKW